MKLNAALRILAAWDAKGRHVFTHLDLSKLFLEDSPKTLQEGINRLVNQGLLIRACRGVYVYAYAKSYDAHTIEHLAV